MTDRVKALRHESLNTQPRICMERAVLETEFYKKHEGTMSIPELRAKSLLHFMEHKTLWLGDGELIVGEKASGPQAAPTFPEICCHSIEDMEVMDARDLINFTVAPEDYDIQKKDVIPYWMGKTMREKILAVQTDAWRACYAAGIFTEFMEQRGPGHTVGSFKLYEKGFMDYKADIAESIAKLDFHKDLEAVSKLEQLKAMDICCDAVMVLGRRYGELARKMALEETRPERRAELEQIAANCEVVPAHAPKTFWQAIQMYWFVHLCVTTELNPWDAYSPGKLDQHLNPFYHADVKAGTLDDDKALELLECLWVKFNNQPAPPKVGITLKESGTYTDFANINSGGITPDGQDGVNPVSYLILDCMDEMKLLQPSSNVQISRKTPTRFLKRACEISRKGWGQPAFYNTEAIVQELLNAGKTLADARCGGTSGCVETGAFGNEAYILTGYFNLPKILEITLNNGIDPASGKQLGLETGNPEDFDSFEALMFAFKCQVSHFIGIKVEGSNRIESVYARYMPAPFLSILTNDCIASGKDYNAGGARYNTSYLQGVGIGTITDSLSAIKYHIFENGSFTMPQLLKALKDDFQGHEDIHALVSNKSPRWGNDDDYADDLMKEVFEHYRGCVTGRPNVRGGMYRVNMLPTTCHVYFGEITGALPSGRKAGIPVSEGISPVGGADIYGPTAVIRSCAKMDHLQTGGTLLNQKYTPSAIQGDKGLDAMAALVRSYFNMEGHHIQFNVIDRDTLIEAQKSPEEHRDLIVRVAGYSDYFRNLSRALQDEIINRTEQAV